MFSVYMSCGNGGELECFHIIENWLHPNVELMLARRLRRRSNINPTLVRVSCLLGSCGPANTRLWHNIVLMLGHRLRRCPNIDLILDQHLVFYVRSCPSNIGPVRQKPGQRHAFAACRQSHLSGGLMSLPAEKKKRGWNPERKVGNVPLLPMWRISCWGCEGIEQNITDGAGLLAGKRSWTLSHQWISTFWSLGCYVLRRQNYFDLISYLMVYHVLKWNWHFIHLMFYFFLLAQEKCLLQKREDRL